jgi:HEAT repeat protein
MPRILMIGSLLLAAALTVFMALSGVSNPGLSAVAGIAAVIGLVGLAMIAWDRFILDSALRPRETGTIERYFQRWLTEFGREQGLFATAANDTVIPTRFRDERQLTFDSIDDVVEYYSRFVLIGEPGEGKSSAIRTLTAQAIYNYRRSNGVTPLPLWINLGYSENPVDASELIGYWWYEQHKLPGNPDVYLNRNNLILYLDGLNEMPEEGGSRTERAESLRQFLAKYPRIPVIATCRVREYEDDQDLSLNLPSLRVLPLTDRQLQTYTRNQLGSDDLWETIIGSKALRRLASSAYRLRMLIEVYQADKTQRLPIDLDTLTQRYVRVRYDEMARAGKVRIKSWEELQATLEQFAFRLVVRGKGTAVSTAKAQQYIGRTALKDGIDLRFLRLEGGIVRFYNHTLHGYFATGPLIDALKNGNGRERIQPRSVDVIRWLGDQGEIAVRAVPDLITALQDSDKMVRRVAAFTLGRIGEGAAAAVPMLVTALSDSEQEVREFAAFALGRIGEGASPAVPALVPALQDENSVVRFGAALALRQMGGAAEPATTALIGALQDENQVVGQLAALALGEIGVSASSAIPMLEQMLRHPNSNIRFSASYALGQMGEAAVPVLINALNTGKADVRIPAAMALREIGRVGLSAVPALVKALDDQNPEVRRAAAFALEKMSTPEADEALRHYYDSQPKEA